jgi:hypothetical protein
MSWRAEGPRYLEDPRSLRVSCTKCGVETNWYRDGVPMCPDCQIRLPLKKPSQPETNPAKPTDGNK